MDTVGILSKYKTVAVVGCSKDDAKYSNMVARFLKGVGYKVIPVNPTADEVMGLKCYKSLLDIPEKVEIVDVFRPSDEALEITRQAVRIGAKVVWLQEGIMSEDARKYANENGLEFVQDRCTMKEYMKM
jgi:uncharacterized protein